MTPKQMKRRAWLLVLLVFVMGILAVMTMNYTIIVIASLIEIGLWARIAYLSSRAKAEQQESKMPKNVLSPNKENK